MVKDSGIINPKDYIGLTLEDATELAKKNGFSTRIVEMNGNPLIVTADLKNNRLNFRVRENKITDVYPG
jgi:hypothetical protein